jgi:predicted GNAT family acetyltransferase
MYEAMDGPVRMTHETARNRYALYVDGELASVAEYTPRGGAVVFDHTETSPRYQGRGLAARVVAFALDDVRRRELSVVPACWFVADFIERHPDYRDLLAA